jgi:hypothetical protein
MFSGLLAFFISAGICSAVPKPTPPRSRAKGSNPVFDKARATALIRAMPYFGDGRSDESEIKVWDKPGLTRPKDRLAGAAAAIIKGETPTPRFVRVTGVKVNGDVATAGFDWYHVDSISGVKTARPQHGIARFKCVDGQWRNEEPIWWAEWDDVDGKGWDYPRAD